MKIVVIVISLFLLLGAGALLYLQHVAQHSPSIIHENDTLPPPAQPEKQD